MNKTTQIAQIGKVKGNIMGTTTIFMKLKGMRAEDDFIVYPIGKDDSAKVITIQSGKRFGKIDLSTGKGNITPSISGGANSIHYIQAQIRKTMQHFDVNIEDVNRIKMQIFGTTDQNAGNNGWIYSDNSGAVNVL